PWNYESRDTTVKRFVRNPYYFRVDEEGNQLPYVDRVVISVVADKEVYTARILSGESDVAFMSVAFENFTLFKENEAAGGYRVSALPGFNASDGGVAFNVNNGDPVKKELYQDVRFRQAMSIAIDREDINEVLYAGQGVPRQFTIGPSVSWFNPEWEQAWAQYDPDLANTMLDELGLTQRSSDGTRLMSNGEPLEIVMYVEAGRGDQPTAIGTVELLIDQWADVGVKLILKPVYPETGGDTWWEIDPDTADASFGLIREATEFAATGIMHNVRQADLRWAMGWNEWFYVRNGGTPQGSSFQRDPGSAYSYSPPEHGGRAARALEGVVSQL
ncbi:MAG: ABC transporter substrate-binding protein, partial [Spirochaetaceae bacterium]|nr:ABC transporter substrate-binding protein [Spirochaetaceae bacterium]